MEQVLWGEKPRLFVNYNRFFYYFRLNISKKELVYYGNRH